MDFRVLGPVEAHKDGTRIALSGSKVHTVLASLLLARGRVVSDTRLNTLLWGWEPPATSGAQIYTYMSRLRKLLGEEVRIERRQPGYLLAAPHSRVDLLEFERLEKLGRDALRRKRFGEAGALLTEALGHWQGTALSNVTEHLADAALPQLEEARMHALESRIEADLALGRHEQLTAELTGLVAQFPLREKLRAQLMTAYYRSGRQSDALQSYYEGRSLLADQLGIDPGEALGSTYEAVLAGNRGPGPGARPRQSEESGYEADDAPAMLLPPDTEDFVGRRAELTALRAQLADAAAGRGPRHLLVTGMAGVGKTALAVHAAYASAAHYPGGCLFAELDQPDGRPRPPAEVLTTLLRGLDEHVGRGGTGSGADGRMELDELVRLYRRRTAGRRRLIVLDGAVGSRGLDPLLSGSPDAVVLITSRARLTQVTTARTTALAPLDDGAAFDLLAASADRARLLAEPDATDDVLAYCAGLPLALRVTGSRLAARPFWPVARLAERLADPETRLRELSHGGLDVIGALMPALRQLPGSEQARTTLIQLADIGADAFPAQRAATHLGTREPAAEQCLEQLVDGALLDICGVDRQGRPLYRFHELVLLLARLLKDTAHSGQPEITAAH
ncbi:BTAD domain-containing putative transcriptional regulator [Streptomyces sp. NBC_01012]|uniref:AfsR/SARP family transcriptional regulator n=1 Tax=Streptomyces sp. NBC_01012 TaxID=2903717 RepID=UPI0038700F0F|nr:AAA family ATPase [Streptomyces sp. NBC_01012]